MALLTFERLLAMYPAYRTKVVLCVRVELPSYGARAKAALAWSHENNELVERINRVRAFVWSQIALVRWAAGLHVCVSCVGLSQLCGLP
jgi:trehalose-6-phosphate synthase